MTDISEMTPEELAAETARLMGWQKLFPPPDVKEQTWADWYDGEAWVMAEHNWDPANNITQAMGLMDELKKRGLQEKLATILTDHWWLKETNQPRRMCEAFVAVMEEANG